MVKRQRGTATTRKDCNRLGRLVAHSVRRPARQSAPTTHRRECVHAPLVARLSCGLCSRQCHSRRIRRWALHARRKREDASTTPPQRHAVRYSATLPAVSLARSPAFTMPTLITILLVAIASSVALGAIAVPIPSNASTRQTSRISLALGGTNEAVHRNYTFDGGLPICSQCGGKAQYACSSGPVGLCAHPRLPQNKRCVTLCRATGTMAKSRLRCRMLWATA